MKPIYVPSGAAKEYGDYALNIYTGCPHRCYYCFSPAVLHVDREKFHSCVEPRPGIIEALKTQIDKENIAGKLIHLCFSCDPYPVGHDSSATREIIKILKAAGNHVQILTKGDGSRDFDLLDSNDWYGVSISGFWGVPKESEPNCLPHFFRLSDVGYAHNRNIKTWISFEPVLSANDVLRFLSDFNVKDYADKVKIGKLNYHPSDINWKDFGIEVERICKERGLDYYIKAGLRAEMEKQR